MPPTDSLKDRDRAKRKAQDHFAKTEQRDELVRNELAKAKAVNMAKTAKLRALRLARDEAEKEAQLAAPAPVKKKRSLTAR